MKKYFSTIICLLGFFALVVTSCKKDEECIDCKANDIAKRTIVLGNGDSTITIYPVMTPNNHSICDSMVYYPDWGTYVEPYKIYKYQKLCSFQEAVDSIKAGNDTACPCRKNLDTVYNDDKNSFFFIENITKFPKNKLIIKTNIDSTQLRTYEDYDNKNNQFIGEVSTDTALGYYEYYYTRPLASGVYSYTLILYKDDMHSIVLGDTITGNFAIVRSPKALNRNCSNEAKDGEDPILSK
ncbi:MAG: hypothetical protein J6X43_05920 [Bacteroidales bacterium]|nr:hypothetical protein [Bacteroidales bacterium]